MPSIQQRSSGRWAVRWRDSNGIQRWRTFEDRPDAERFSDRVDIEIRAQLHGLTIARNVPEPAPSETMVDYYEGWVGRQVWRQSTTDQVVAEFRRYVLPTFGTRRLSDISHDELQRWVRDLSERLAPATVRVIVAHARSLFLAAEKSGQIERSPVTGLRLPRRDRRLVVPPTAAQILQVRDALPDRYRTLVDVAAGTGMRQGELFGLTSDRVRADQIVVDRQLVKTSAGRHLAPPKTDASVRVVPVPADLVNRIGEHVEQFGTSVEGLIFTSPSGGSIDRSRFSDVWTRVAPSAGFARRQGLHSIRHFYASALIRAGCSVKVVQARLGHATASETLDTYAHIWDDDDDRTREAVSGLLSP